MSIKYDISVIELLHLLGYKQPQNEDISNIITQFEEQNKIQFPQILKKFLLLAIDNPLLATADVWNEMPYFYSEMLEEDEEYLKENMEEYLLIGSDCGAGVVVFGIRITDLNKENPPVYMHHEGDEFMEWNCLFDSVAEYLMTILCDVISCVEYDTGKKVLHKLGWNYKEYKEANVIWQQLKKQEINLENAIKHKSIYGIDAEVYCCYNEAANQLFVIRKDGKEFEMCALSGQATV